MTNQGTAVEEKRAFLAYENDRVIGRFWWCRRDVWTLMWTVTILVALTWVITPKGGAILVMQDLPPWQEGLLDLHHLRVGASESTFVVFPDGTTLLIDGGEINIPKQLQVWKETNSMLRIKPNVPSSLKTTGEGILDNVRHFWPSVIESTALDYVLVTHFHEDHIGDPSRNDTSSTSGAFLRTGLPEIGDQLSVETWIDRNYPSYDFPRDMRKLNYHNLQNYLDFIEEYSDKGMKVERFQVGSTTQITMKHKPSSIPTHFRVKNIKSNLDVWNDATKTIDKIPGTLLKKSGSWNDNFLSSAIVLEYGNFRYYEGGDQDTKDHIDTVTPTAKASQRIHVAALNHHGHGVNRAFTDEMDPNVLILQGWCSDQPPDASMEVISRMKRLPHLFATDIFDERLENMTNPDWKRLFQSRRGHVVVRVYPPSAVDGNQQYDVVILNENRQVERKFGPFLANPLVG